MFTVQQKKTPTNVCDLAGGTVGPRESVAAIAFTNANSSIQNLLKIIIPALEQPEAGAKFRDTQITRGASGPVGLSLSSPGTTTTNAYPPFERYRVDAFLRMEEDHG
jgi:hypothetical protein